MRIYDDDELFIKDGLTCKEPDNNAESIFFKQAKRNGWAVTKRGYPDFFCYKDGKLVLVEVKPKASHNLSRNQLRQMEIFASYGIHCYKWSPDGGFEKVSPRR